MKQLFIISVCLLLYSVIILPQDAVNRDVLSGAIKSERLFKDKFGDNPKKFLNENEDNYLKIKSINSKASLGNQQGDLIKENRLYNAEVNTTMRKTLLENGFLLVEEIFQYVNGTKYVNDQRDSYTYDGNNNLIEYLSQKWNGTDWINASGYYGDGRLGKYLYTYNGNNKLTEERWQNWENNVWVDFVKYSYTYDLNNNLIEILWQSWDVNDWRIVSKYSYTYDTNSKLTEELNQAWDGNVWVNWDRHIYIYDENNKQTQWLYQYWLGDNWLNNSNCLFTYDGNYNLIEKLYQQWGSTDWWPKDKFSYTYDIYNNQTEELYQRWNGNAWMDVVKKTYAYNSNNELYEGQIQNWDGTAWVNYWKEFSTYDGNSNLIEWIRQAWDGTGWANYRKNLYTYSSATGIKNNLISINSYDLSNNYPNPFNPSTKIKYQIAKAGFVSLKVYDILGREVTTLVNEEKSSGSYEVNFDASGLTSGVYFYQINVENYMNIKKMILLK